MTTLSVWLDEGKLRSHRTTSAEVLSLFRVIDRDLRDASLAGLSTDRRYTLAYNAGLQLCAVALHATGYTAMPDRDPQNFTVQSLVFTVGKHLRTRSAYLNDCRIKRNLLDDRYGVVSDADAQELLTEVLAFRQDILQWLGEHHPNLVPEAATVS